MKDIPALDTVYFTMPNYYLPDSFVVKYRYSVTRIYSNTHPKSIEPQGFILQGKKYNSTYFTITDSLWQTLPNRPSSYDSLLKQTPQLTEDDYDANTKSFMRALLFFNTVIGLPLFILLGIIALVYEKKE